MTRGSASSTSRRGDGSFEVSPSKSLRRSLETACELGSEADCRARWLDGALPSIDAGLSSEVLVVGLYRARNDDGTPEGKVRVTVRHGGPETPELAERLKAS